MPFGVEPVVVRIKLSQSCATGLRLERNEDLKNDGEDDTATVNLDELTCDDGVGRRGAGC